MDYDKLIAPAAAAMRPSGIRKFFDLAAEMPECISLGVGEPDFKTPWAVREAGIESLEHGRTRYTSNAGLKELRAEIARYLDRRMGLKYDPAKEVLVTVGGSEAIDMCIRALVQPGDEVIIPEPCFVCYEPITTLSGGVPVHVACRQEDEFRLRADALKAAITPKTKLLIMPFPNNPTGAVMEREDLDIMSEFMVMAATLLDIKCRMLLPKEVNEEGEEEDPRAELVQQLLEYKMYKYMSYELRDRMNEASRSVYKEPTLPREVLEYRTPVDTSELLSQISLAKLHTIYKMILKRQEDKIDPIRSKFGKIEKEEVSLPDKMTYVEQFAVKKRRFSFRDLLESQPGKVHVIVTFLAILELMKTGKIRISQEELFGDILIESLEDEDTVVVPYTDETDSEDKTDGRTEQE